MPTPPAELVDAHRHLGELGPEDVPALRGRPGARLEDLEPWQQHIGFDQAPGVLMRGWMSFVEQEVPELPLQECAVVSVTCDYLAEIKPGPFEVRTQLSRLGTSSLDLHQHLVQAPGVIVVGRTTVVRKDFATVRSAPLTPQQRASLRRHLKP